MKTKVECIPCLVSMTVEIAKMAGATDEQQKKILAEIGTYVHSMDYSIPPPEMAREVYYLIHKHTGVVDPYDQVKIECNTRALELFPQLEAIVEKSEDKLLTSIELAIAGNIIDYGVQGPFDVEEEINKLFTEEFVSAAKARFEYEKFCDELSKAQNILYLGDNAGEVVFDKLLLKELLELGKTVTFAVRGKPILNDITMADAHYVGIDKMVPVISNGVCAPGTLLKYCSEEFLDHFNSADMIISKGQGNFETLYATVKRPIYFLFKVKCPILTKELDCALGDVMLKGQSKDIRL